MPAALRDSPKVKWVGVDPARPRQRIIEMPICLSPTVSDGFGMTQVEARGWKLPVITTPFCAPIIQHEVNGLVIRDANGKLLANAVRALLHDPRKLGRLAAGAATEYEPYSFLRVQERFLALKV